MMWLLLRGAALMLLAWVFGLVVFMLTLPDPAPDMTTDAVVVLTGAPGRIDHGLDLLERRKARRLLISGVDRSVRPVELAVAAGRPEALFDCCVDLGFGAVDTRSNAGETAEWVRRHRYHSLRLVTSDWHMPRARLELAAQLGDSVRVVPDPVVAERAPWPLIQEYSKYVLRRLALWLGI